MNRPARVMLIGLLLSLLLTAGAPALSETLQAAPISTESASADGMIRVWLSSIKSKSTYDMTVAGSYSLGGTTLSNGSKVRIEFSGGTVYATVNGSRTSMGQSATLTRGSGGVRIAQSLVPSNLYPGDIRFFYSGGTAYVVVTLFVEDYLYGVLPYEMDNSFPLEALKAQAVTARTYAMRAKKSSGSYDVTDTTTHQVFRGVNSGKTRCIQAVDETWGVVLKYNGAYAATYYSASNGGQTEANNHAWGGTGSAYLTVKDDPYDLMNAMSVKKSYMIYASPSKGKSASAYSMIQSALSAKLGGGPAGYTIEEITDVMLHTPSFTAPSKLYTRMQISAVYNGGQRTTVDLPIFSTVESALGLSINGEKNELWTVEREANGFRVISRRFGHGVGMSQRGAQQMGDLGFSYAQILGFYFPGAVRARMSLTTKWPGVTQTPAIPVEASDIQENTPAKVVLENTSDRLNLRAEANDSSTILARIPHGTDVMILSADGNWLRIEYSGQKGYALRQYLVWEQRGASQTAPSADQRTATVTLLSGTLNLRGEAQATAKVLATIPNGASVALLEEGAAWSRVRYAGVDGYVMTQYLTVSAQAGTGESSQSAASGMLATVQLDSTGETLNFRLDPMIDAPILAKLPHGTVLTVLEKNAEWSKLSYQGLVGYAMNAYIAFSEGTVQTPGVTDSSTTADASYYAPAAAAAAAEVRYATVSVPSGKLNLRAQPNPAADVSLQIKNGRRIGVTQVGDDWCGVTVDGVSGYVARGFLVFDEEPTRTPTATPDAAQSPDVSQTSASTTSTPSVAWVVTQDGDRVNLRRNASSSSTILVRVPHGAAVSLKELGDSWSKVAYDGYTGYIATNYLTLAMPEGATSASAAQAVDMPKATQTPSGSPVWIASANGLAVNLRKERSTTSDALALIDHGTEVTLLESDAQWCRVIHKGLTGYVVTDFVRTTQPAVTAEPTQAASAAAEAPAAQADAQVFPVPTAAPLPAQQPDVLIIGDARTTVLNSGKTRLNSPTAILHLYEKPDPLSDEIGGLSQNNPVEVLQLYGDEWVYVRYGNMEGYALATHFALDYKFAQVALSDTASQLTVREKASKDSAAIAELSHGAVVAVLDAASGYSKVRLVGGTVGYIASEFLVYR